MSMLSVVTRPIMLGAVMLSVVTLNVIMLSVVAPLCTGLSFDLGYVSEGVNYAKKVL